MRRMEMAAAATDFASAKKLLDDTLNAVEDELTDIPYDPTLWESDGRMYPVQDDNVRSVTDRPLHPRQRLARDPGAANEGSELQQGGVG